MFIALSGYARSGKDSVADILEEQGFGRTAFANPLRQCVEALNPIVHTYPAIDDEALVLRYNDVLNDIGYDAGKETYPEFREILQRMGTEVGRNIIDDNLWVDLALKQARESDIDNWVFTDCRFPNEARAATDADGVVWRIERPGVGPANDHISEHALEGYDFDLVINNDGTLEDLRETVLQSLALSS